MDLGTERPWLLISQINNNNNNNNNNKTNQIFRNHDTLKKEYTPLIVLMKVLDLSLISFWNAAARLQEIAWFKWPGFGQ